MALCIAGVNKDCVAWTFQPVTNLCWLKNAFAEKQVYQNIREGLHLMIFAQFSIIVSPTGKRCSHLWDEGVWPFTLLQK